MTENGPAIGDTHGAEALLSALVELVTAWSSPTLQARIAQGAGIEIGEVDIRTLHTLGRLGGGARPAQIADELHLTRPTTSKSLTRLEAAGLITRTRAIQDRRATDVVLTDAGQRAYLGLVEAGIAMVQHALAETPGVDTDSVIRFTRALRESV